MRQPNKVSGEYLIEKFPGKGGWTYILIPEIPMNKDNPFGWVVVSGTIDKYKLDKVKLMPFGDGRLFLPLKVELRKAIKKQAGDKATLRIEIDETPVEVPQEIIDCFENEPMKIYEAFNKLSESEKKAYLDWIYSARSEDKKVERIAEMMRKLDMGISFYNKI